MLKKTLIFIAAALLFVLGLGIFGVVSSTLTSKEKKALEKIRLEEKKLSQSFDVVVVQSGFRLRSTGQRDIYIPSLLVRVTNISALTSNEANLTVEFLKKRRTFCRARGAVQGLKPREYCEMWLKCIDFVGFGSVAWGLSLAETTEGLDYVVFLRSGRTSIIVAEDKLGTIFF